jgi:hypothetical protein
MASAKPVLTYIAPELERLYVHHGLLEVDELPVVRVDYRNLEDALRALTTDAAAIASRGQRARDFVLKHHSLGAVGKKFAEINRALGHPPATAAGPAP